MYKLIRYSQCKSLLRARKRLRCAAGGWACWPVFCRKGWPRLPPLSPYSLSHCCRWLGLFAGLLISPRKHSRAFSSLSLSRSSSLSRAAAGGWACWPVYCISEKLLRAFSSLRVGAAGGWACWPVFCIKRLQHRCINLKRLLRFSALLLPCCSSRKECASQVCN